MAQLQTRASDMRQADKPDTATLIEQALHLIKTIPQPRTEAEVVRRLRRIKELLAGVEIPRRERRGLDGALLVFALDEPGSSEKTWVLRSEIISEITPKHQQRKPRRDAQGRIIQSQPLQPLTEEEIQLLSKDEDNSNE